ncbi:MAG: DUF4234 domain-containing protein [Clostridia bacterium]|nr:DUF4234 domain-containing protein [Clostridia bacterium]
MAKKKLNAFDVIACALALAATLCVFLKAIGQDGDGYTGVEIVFGAEYHGVKIFGFNFAAFIAYFLPILGLALTVLSGIIGSRGLGIGASIVYFLAMIMIAVFPIYWYDAATKDFYDFFKELEVEMLAGPALALYACAYAFEFGIIGAALKYDYVEGEEYQQGEISLGKLFGLNIVTLGIYQFVWMHRTTRFTNVLEDEKKMNPTTQVLLCCFIPIYSIYWYYKNAQKMELLFAKKGMRVKCVTLCTVCAIFVPIVSMLILQDKINNACSIYCIDNLMADSKSDSTVEVKSDSMLDGVFELDAPSKPAQISVQLEQVDVEKESNKVDLLKRYKELLDAGVITEEEFEQKKKQLLK